MNKTNLVYGTYRKKEWDRIVAIFEEYDVEYTNVENVRVFTDEGGRYKDEWHFYQLNAYVTPEEEKLIRAKRDRLKKIYS